MNKRHWLLPGLLGATLLLHALSLGLGSVALTPEQLWDTLTAQADPLASSLVFDLRLPRTLNAFTTGALLALAGTLMQVLLRNPLADPYVLGISGGAGLVALLAIMAGLGGYWITGGAFVGALTAMLLVTALSHGMGPWNSTRLLLTGVILAMGWGALISLLLAIAPNESLRGMLFWLMGDLGYGATNLASWLVLALALLIMLPRARDLNLLSHGELQAAALGVDHKPLRRWLYLTASLLTATAVAQAGSIGFIGLLTPHLLRLTGCHDHRQLLVAAPLLGGTLLLAADIVARTIIAPQQLPTGVITALLGIPLFLALLWRQPR